MSTWKDKERVMPELTPELRKINEYIAAGMKGRQIQEIYKMKNKQWTDEFKKKHKIPFVYYKMEILKRLKEGTYE